jgi:hypothetical protein
MIKMATIRAASGLICSATSIGSTPTPPSDSATPKSYRPVKATGRTQSRRVGWSFCEGDSLVDGDRSPVAARPCRSRSGHQPCQVMKAEEEQGDMHLDPSEIGGTQRPSQRARNQTERDPQRPGLRAATWTSEGADALSSASTREGSGYLSAVLSEESEQMNRVR